MKKVSFFPYILKCKKYRTLQHEVYNMHRKFIFYCENFTIEVELLKFNGIE